MLNVHVYPSTFEYETRILKVTKSLIEHTGISRILVIARSGPGLPAVQEIDRHRTCWRVGTTLRGERFWSKALQFVEWSGRVIACLRTQSIDVVNCHSLSVLPVCVALKWWHHAKLVYEPHELETETQTFTGYRRSIAKRVEGILIRFADKVIVVSDTIAEHYKQDYRLEHVAVVRNAPPLVGDVPPPRTRVLREKFNIPDGHLVFMYQGALDRQRGCDLLVDAFIAAPENRHLIFLGFGPMEEEIEAAAREHPNIHFHPAVHPDRIMDLTRGADVGFALLEDSCENHRCALPNKFFHYLHAGLPVIVSDLEQMGRIVDTYGCGWRVRNTAEALADQLRALTPERVSAAERGARECRQALHWGNEEQTLIAEYAEIASLKPLADSQDAAELWH